MTINKKPNKVSDAAARPHLVTEPDMDFGEGPELQYEACAGWDAGDRAVLPHQLRDADPWVLVIKECIRRRCCLSN